ncbi:MAG: hypothetical protein J0M19_12775, partial [Sphingomonadales bacterium]|nr:hypothetical protein [Sphingomonadales bacterium]
MVRRHVLVWIVAAAAIALTSFAASGEDPRTARELHEALLRLNLLIPVFILPFIAAALAPVFYLREVEHGMTPLLAAYPQTSRAWLAVRLASFAGLLIGICAIMQAAIVGFLAWGYPDQMLTVTRQTVKLMAFVHIPAAVIWAVVLGRVSCAAGKASMVYLAAAFGWLGYIALATMTGTPLIAGSFVAWEPLRAAMMLADPYAVTALVNPPSPHGSVYSREIAITLGRIGWLTVCYLLVRGIAAIPALIPARDDARPVGHQPLHRAARWQSPGYFALLMRWSLLDKFFLLALLGWTLLIFPEVFSGMAYAEPLSVLVPDSRDALNRVMWDMAAPLGALVLLYTADRVGRMASTNGMAELTAATPYPSWRFLTAQLVCLWLVALALLAFTLAVVLIAQLAANSAIQLREYLEQGTQ